MIPARASDAFSRHCAVLGLRTVHSSDELNAAYRPLIRQWHPDRHHGSASHAIALGRAKAINEAYAFLLAALNDSREGETARPSVASTAARSARGHGFPDASVLEIFVTPSNILSVGYISTTAELFVKSLGNRIYRYCGVPPTVVEALLAAPSASAFVSEHLDRQYEYEAYTRSW